jgi:hypothetical protein
MSLTDAEARESSPALNALQSDLANVGVPTRRDDLDVRLANVVVAWSALRHFYPYWGDIPVDWDERLRPQLQRALDAAPTRTAHLDVVRMLVADLHDGHGMVYDATASAQWMLPVQVRMLAGQVVVTASNDTTIPVGSLVLASDGTPAAPRLRREMQLASGTPQWRAARAASLQQMCRIGSTVELTIELPAGGQRETSLPCDRSTPRVFESRPDSVSELEPGIWYVDLTRARASQLTPLLPALAAARGVIFDLRGYPTDAGYAILPYLLRTPEDSAARWMHVPRYVRPFGEVAEWESTSWFVQASAPHIAGTRVFMTDGRAISYAESVMGYVRDHALGTIIGGVTAGANGNIASFTLPGGMSIIFTGMRVTRHDGRTPFHGIGVAPHISLEPTLAGIRAGRDEVLERALVEVKQ